MPGYAELKLYFGFVNSRGFREGRFERELVSQRSRLAIAQAREEIERHLQPNCWGLTIGYSDNGVAQTEEEALLLIRHAETCLKNAAGIVVPFDVIHGSLRFFRVIRFDNVGRESLEKIVEAMKQSGHLPYTRERFRQDFVNDEREFLQRNDRQWRAALKFY